MESLAALPFFQFRLAFSCDVLVRGRHAVSVLSIRASVKFVTCPCCANPHWCPLQLPNYLIMSLSDNTAINAGVSVEAANHLSLFLTTPGSTATSNQVLHKIVIVDQVSFDHSLISPLLAKNVWQFSAMLFASMAPQPSISKFLPRALSHPCATPVPPLCHPLPPRCYPCATLVPPLCLSCWPASCRVSNTLRLS